MATPLVSVVGRHNTGKTTLIEGLVARLKAKGLRVAVLKHTRGDFTVDRAGTDTWRHAQAGADVVAIVGPTGAAVMESWEQEPDLDAILRRLPADLDLIVVEGYKSLPLPKIVVCGQAADEAKAYIGPVVAMVSQEPLPDSDKTPCVTPDDIDGLLRVLIAGGYVPAGVAE